MSIKIHDLKTWPKPFDAMRMGLKTFEFRLNDRNFEPGDYLRLMEYNPKTRKYTGNEDLMRITYILHGGEFGVPDGYCIMSLRDLVNDEYNEIFNHKP